MHVDRKRWLKSSSSHVGPIHGDIRTVETLALRGEAPNSPDDDCGLARRGYSTGGMTHVVWEFWKATQSQFRYRETGVIDLGIIEG